MVKIFPCFQARLSYFVRVPRRISSRSSCTSRCPLRSEKLLVEFLCTNPSDFWRGAVRYLSCNLCFCKLWNVPNVFRFSLILTTSCTTTSTPRLWRRQLRTSKMLWTTWRGRSSTGGWRRIPTTTTCRASHTDTCRITCLNWWRIRWVISSRPRYRSQSHKSVHSEF